MPTTQNGFPVIDPADIKKLHTYAIGKQKILVAERAWKLLKRWSMFLHAIEPITEAGWDGAYCHRLIPGTKVWSEHSAGTALDWNASQHPQGTHLPCGWTDTQIRAIRWALAHTATGPCITWGADFKHTPDPMHFELKSPLLLDAYNQKNP
jgi:hypothetical protein